MDRRLCVQVDLFANGSLYGKSALGQQLTFGRLPADVRFAPLNCRQATPFRGSAKCQKRTFGPASARA